MIPLLVLLGVGPLLAWKRADILQALTRLWAAAVLTAIVCLFIWSGDDGKSVGAVVGFGIAAWIVGGVLTEYAERIRLFRISIGASLRRATGLSGSSYGMMLAHLGLAAFITGAVGDTFWGVEAVANARPGDKITLGPYDITFDKMSREPGPNYEAEFATMTVTRDGEPVTRLRPERRIYPVQRMPTTEAAIHTTLARDLYVSVGEGNQADGWAVHAWINPLVPWMWIGALMMVCGGLVSLSDRRLRVGAPKRISGAAPQPVGGD